MNKLYNNKEWLKNEYWNKGKLQKEIADELNIDKNTISRNMKRLGIKTRSHSERHKGNFNGNWKGGKWKTFNGYKVVLKPDHPFVNKTGYIFEHILIIEELLGRYVKKEEKVHHIDLDKSNNNTDNLIILPNMKAHNKAHKQLQEVVSKLIKKGIIQFNIKTNKYFWQDRA